MPHPASLSQAGAHGRNIARHAGLEGLFGEFVGAIRDATRSDAIANTVSTIGGIVQSIHDFPGMVLHVIGSAVQKPIDAVGQRYFGVEKWEKIKRVARVIAVVAAVVEAVATFGAFAEFAEGALLAEEEAWAARLSEEYLAKEDLFHKLAWGATRAERNELYAAVRQLGREGLGHSGDPFYRLPG
jgi:hypothetical protein